MALNAYECFSKQAALTPNATAVHYQGQSFSYAELNSRSTKLAHFMVEGGLTKGAVVGVCLPPTFDLIVAMLAVWKAGGVYLPLDSEYPAERSLNIADEAGCRFIVTVAPISYPFQRPGTYVVYVDAWSDQIALRPTEPLHNRVYGDDLAYLMYTSGSTGKPKGVMVSHSSLVNKLVHPGTWGVVSSECRSALLTSIAFDPSLVQIMLPLTHGGSVLVVHSSERLNPERIWSRLAEYDVTVLDCTPSWLQAMLEHPIGNFSPDRIVLGGETLTPVFAKRVQTTFADAQLVNIYGPTETCVDATAYELQPDDFSATSIAIGKALPGYRLRILGDGGDALIVGEVGELHIGGTGLARGYWRNPIATGEAFIVDPEDRSERWYRTGDLVRERKDGNIEYIKRSDDQIKLRGQRVELGEVENALAQLPDVASAIVKVWPSENGIDSQLIGYVVATKDQPNIDSHALRETLAERLPSFMVPSTIEVLDALPLSTTGKVDRTALVKPERPPAPLSEEDLPRDDIEKALAGIWKEMLEIEQISIHDNFFELGGHSLKAVQLLSAVNNRFSTGLSLSALLTHPSIADFSIALARGVQTLHREESNARVMPLGSKPNNVSPLFFIPPASGVGLIYIGIARELSGITPTVALQMFNMPNKCAGDIDMAQLVSELIKDIERVQPEGDIRLCAYSAGGAVTMEMARELQKIGRHVSHIFLIDPYLFDGSDTPSSAPLEENENAFWDVCVDMISDATGIRGVAADQILQVTKTLWLDLLSVGKRADDAEIQPLLEEARKVLPEQINLEIFILLLEGVGNLWHASKGHKNLAPLSEFSGNAWFIQPDADPEDYRLHREEFWKRLAGPQMQSVLVPGEHSSMLHRARCVSAIGAQMRTILGRSS